MFTDPIADYLTRIRNACMAKKSWVEIPSSNMKIRLSYVLKEEKFIRDYVIVEDDKQNLLRIYLFLGNCINKFTLFSKKLFFLFFSNFLKFVSKNILYLM